MKGTNKNRKHPTCSRCRFHGKKDIRVLQHQCPYRNCTCSSCFLIKRRSIIYRAQKNLDKQEDNSDDCSPSPSGSVQSTIGAASQFSELGNNSADGSYPAIGSVNRCSDGGSNFSSSHMQGIGSLHNHQQPLWNSSSDPSHNHSHNSAYTTSIKSTEHCKIGDFHRLCLTFPDHSPSQLQAHYEQCGNDFQRTIDKILEQIGWCNESESNPYFQQQQNEWSMNCNASSAASCQYASGFGSHPFNNSSANFSDFPYLDEMMSSSQSVEMHGGGSDGYHTVQAQEQEQFGPSGYCISNNNPSQMTYSPSSAPFALATGPSPYETHDARMPFMNSTYCTQASSSNIAPLTISPGAPLSYSLPGITSLNNTLQTEKFSSLPNDMTFPPTPPTSQTSQSSFIQASLDSTDGSLQDVLDTPDASSPHAPYYNR